MKTENIKNQVMDYLMWSSARYQSHVFKAFFYWCELHGKEASVTQQLLTNKAINQWFLTEYQKQEIAFIKALPGLPSNALVRKDIYLYFTGKIVGLCPVALVKGIKTNQLFATQGFFKGITIYQN